MADSSPTDSAEQPGGKTRKKPNPGRNLPVAIGVAALLLCWIIGSLLFWHWGFVIFLMTCVVFGSYEIVAALGKRGMHAAFAPLAIGGPIMVSTSYAVAMLTGQLGGVVTVLAGLSLMVVASLLIRLSGPVRGYLSDAAASIFTIGYVPLLLSMVTLLLTQDDGNWRVLLYILLVACSDTSAYAVGILFGKHKMAPRISPAKSWEGFAGALVITAAVGAWLVPLVIDGSWWAGAIIGFCLALAGAIGDLVESMIKRDAGIKDMSNILPGHGGAMDRLDSLLIAAPIAWLTMFTLV